ncbi:hypothetical protein V5799_028078 [Amblyomma americanum]|uniref:Gamma-glutamyltransferase n=1 Tax=Amblyomma americanum TaxID=6943 RepID=A0AAQ4DDW5_AMBAM
MRAMVCTRLSPYATRFASRLPVIAARAAVVSDEVLASQAGLDVLRRGGNAADAALAMSACMQVLQPYSTGVGGDCFALYYDARTKKVHCVDGSGRSPAALTLEQVQTHSRAEGPLLKRAAGLYATVPGAPKAWFYIARRFGSGKLTLSEIFDPAVRCAEHGFPMDHSKKLIWALRHKDLQRKPGGRYFLDEDGRVPSLGQIITNRPLAALLRRLAQEGPRVMYEGPVAESMVDAVRQAGGVLSTEDLAAHLASTEPLEVEPISTTYRGDVRVHTTPLPTQGAVLLETLNILEGFDLQGLRHIPGDFEHVVIEALRHAVADGLRHVADAASGGSVGELLSKERASKLREQVKLDRRVERVYPEVALPYGQSGTTFAAAADDVGNVCAMMGSIALSFGCAVVKEHGFAVQVREQSRELIQ